MEKLQRYAPMEMDDRIDMIVDSAGHWVKGPEAEAALAEKDGRIAKLKARVEELEPGWVSIEDRLPTTQVDLLVMAPWCEVMQFTPDGHCGQCGNVFERYNHEEDNYQEATGITHWRPLPAAPGVGDEP